MVDNRSEVRLYNSLGFVINFIALIFALYGLLKNPDIVDVVFLVSILFFISIYLIVSYFINNFLDELNKINDNFNSISDIKKDLNKINEEIINIKEVAKLDARLSFLEKKLK